MGRLRDGATLCFGWVGGGVDSPKILKNRKLNFIFLASPAPKKIKINSQVIKLPLIALVSQIVG